MATSNKGGGLLRGEGLIGLWKNTQEKNRVSESNPDFANKIEKITGSKLQDFWSVDEAIARAKSIQELGKSELESASTAETAPLKRSKLESEVAQETAKAENLDTERQKLESQVKESLLKSEPEGREQTTKEDVYKAQQTARSTEAGSKFVRNVPKILNSVTSLINLLEKKDTTFFSWADKNLFVTPVDVTSPTPTKVTGGTAFEQMAGLVGGTVINQMKGIPVVGRYAMQAGESFRDAEVKNRQQLFDLGKPSSLPPDDRLQKMMSDWADTRVNYLFTLAGSQLTGYEKPEMEKLVNIEGKTRTQALRDLYKVQSSIINGAKTYGLTTNEMFQGLPEQGVSYKNPSSLQVAPKRTSEVSDGAGPGEEVIRGIDPNGSPKKIIVKSNEKSGVQQMLRNQGWKI